MDIYLPWRNEFGTLISDFCRWINGQKSDHKIVCCKKGHEALFPSAKDFYYDWEDISDDWKRGMKTFRSKHQRQFLDQLTVKLKQEYPEANIIEHPVHRRTPIRKHCNFIPKPTKLFGISCDIVIAPRFRKYAAHRNYDHWPAVAEGLIKAGYKLGAIGAKDLSLDIDGIDVKSWDHNDTKFGVNADIELIRSSKLVIATDSGLAHLSILCQAPTKIIYGEEGILPGNNRRRIGWMMHIHRGFAENHCEPIIMGWDDPQKVVDETISFLDNDTNT